MNKNSKTSELKIKNLWKYIKIPKLTDLQQKTFSESFNIQAIIFFRFSLYVLLTAIFPYYILDYYSAPQSYKTIWFIRFIFFFLIIILALWISYKPFIIKYFQLISNSVNILLNVGVLLMIYVSDVGEAAYSNYYIGLIVIMGVVIAMRIRLYPALLNFGIIISLYILLAVFHQKLPFGELLSNLFFILGIVLAVGIANLLLEIYTRKTFLQEKLLEQKAEDLKFKNQKINEINNELLSQNEEIKSQRDEIIAQRDEIEQQRDIVVKQKELGEIIHNKIAQSIDYATRLQKAILPKTKILEKYLSDFFVLFKPKDKVSGDFYWWAYVENHTIITAADSTGHGVPGAFMSMLGISFLREIVQKEYITHPGVILRKLRKEIIKTLKQKGEIGEQKDGMDMAIISIDHENNTVQYSGANNPLYIIKKHNSNEDKQTKKEQNNSALTFIMTHNNFELYEIRPDKMPIAIYEKMDNFTTHKIQVEKGDVLYMFTDGYADQFGGPKGKKFKYKPFKRLLLENADKTMKEQKDILNQTFEAWKGNLEQVDDMVVLGVKI